jgi:hypothetical protein
MIVRYVLQYAHHAIGNVVIISKSQPSLIIYLFIFFNGSHLGFVRSPIPNPPPKLDRLKKIFFSPQKITQRHLIIFQS